MKASINDFVLLRDNIVRNSLLNTLLIATLSRITTSDMITLATTYIPAEQDTKNRLKKTGIISSATHLLYDIIVHNTPYRCHIGIRYAGHPIIWQTHIWEQSISEAGKIKSAVQKIFECYPIQNHAILPPYPTDFQDFLETQQTSIETWQNGNRITMNNAPTVSVNTSVKKYYEALEKLLFDYRCLNHLLILLLKHHKNFQLISGNEVLKSIPSAMNGGLLLDYHNSTEKKSELLYISELNPQSYNSRPHTIPLEIINKFLLELRKS